MVDSHRFLCELWREQRIDRKNRKQVISSDIPKKSDITAHNGAKKVRQEWPNNDIRIL